MTIRRNDTERAMAVTADELTARTPPGVGTLMLAALVLVSVAGAVCVLVYLLLLAIAPGDNRVSFLEPSPIRASPLTTYP